jgi:hypothetical protein
MDEIIQIIKNSTIKETELILYNCIDRLNLIDVYSFCKKHECKRDNIYKKIKSGKIPVKVNHGKIKSRM